MSATLEEHDYIGLSGIPSMETSEKLLQGSEINKGLNLKATELRLGLPGSESPERDLTHLKGFISGAKRGFFDTTINSASGSGKWVLSGNDGSELDLSKNGGLFSPRGANSSRNDIVPESNYQKSVSSVKDAIIPVSPKPAPERKPQITAPAAKAQVVGWPPVRSYRKNSMASGNLTKKNSDESDNTKLTSDNNGFYVKVSMDGAPYLRKVDLNVYLSYTELSSALEKMFSCFTIGKCSSSHGDGLSASKLMDLLHGSEYVLTYEDKDGDWMLVGDVPWQMFMNSCKRMRIMKSSDAIGLAPRAMEKRKTLD
ncbi:auxin-responsive protein IAA27-like [Impatiens glandulifera]|uniref:auxin-responsive protein IAA27-like n=1 Tax=Impatiens glandulifera TaxID=253017 RepID=UPI001FB0C440|nr:auxin-responsive protein IAA27-like [Impatiens glandulifera]